MDKGLVDRFIDCIKNNDFESVQELKTSHSFEAPEKQYFRDDIELKKEKK